MSRAVFGFAVAPNKSRPTTASNITNASIATVQPADGPPAPLSSAPPPADSSNIPSKVASNLPSVSPSVSISSIASTSDQSSAPSSSLTAALQAQPAPSRRESYRSSRSLSQSDRSDDAAYSKVVSRLLSRRESLHQLIAPVPSLNPSATAPTDSSTDLVPELTAAKSNLDLDSMDFARMRRVLLSAVAKRELDRRQRLAKATAAREAALIRLARVHEAVRTRVEMMVREQRHLDAAKKKARTLQRRGDARAATLIECVRRLEKERKTMLARIKAPSWEIPHHFHMTAVEHWMGNQQPQLFEVADLIKGHLRIATIARSSAQQPGKVVAALAATRSERQVLSNDIATIDRMLVELNTEIEAAQNVVDNIASRLTHEGYSTGRAVSQLASSSVRAAIASAAAQLDGGTIVEEGSDQPDTADESDRPTDDEQHAGDDDEAAERFDSSDSEIDVQDSLRDEIESSPTDNLLDTSGSSFSPTTSGSSIALSSSPAIGSFQPPPSLLARSSSSVSSRTSGPASASTVAATSSPKLGNVVMQTTEDQAEPPVQPVLPASSPVDSGSTPPAVAAASPSGGSGGGYLNLKMRYFQTLGKQPGSPSPAVATTTSAPASPWKQPSSSKALPATGKGSSAVVSRTSSPSGLSTRRPNAPATQSTVSTATSVSVSPTPSTVNSPVQTVQVAPAIEPPLSPQDLPVAATVSSEPPQSNVFESAIDHAIESAPDSTPASTPSAAADESGQSRSLMSHHRTSFASLSELGASSSLAAAEKLTTEERSAVAAAVKAASSTILFPSTGSASNAAAATPAAASKPLLSALVLPPASRVAKFTFGAWKSLSADSAPSVALERAQALEQTLMVSAQRRQCAWEALEMLLDARETAKQEIDELEAERIAAEQAKRAEEQERKAELSKSGLPGTAVAGVDRGASIRARYIQTLGRSASTSGPAPKVSAAPAAAKPSVWSSMAGPSGNAVRHASTSSGLSAKWANAGRRNTESTANSTTKTSAGAAADSARPMVLRVARQPPSSLHDENALDSSESDLDDVDLDVSAFDEAALARVGASLVAHSDLGALLDAAALQYGVSPSPPAAGGTAAHANATHMLAQKVGMVKATPKAAATAAVVSELDALFPASVSPLPDSPMQTLMLGSPSPPGPAPPFVNTGMFMPPVPTAAFMGTLPNAHRMTKFDLHSQLNQSSNAVASGNTSPPGSVNYVAASVGSGLRRRVGSLSDIQSALRAELAQSEPQAEDGAEPSPQSQLPSQA